MDESKDTAETVKGTSDGQLVMVSFSENLLVIGKLKGKSLLKPRIFDIYLEKVKTPEGTKEEERMRMRVFPGTPPLMTPGNHWFMYPISIRDDAMRGLYDRVTNPSVDPGV